MSKSYTGLLPDPLHSASMTGLVDTSALLGGEKQNSNLTSTVDSVMSYLGADKKGEAMSERSDLVMPGADGKEY